MNEARNTTISVARNTVITLTGDTINANTLRQLIPDQPYAQVTIRQTTEAGPRGGTTTTLTIKADR